MLGIAATPSLFTNSFSLGFQNKHYPGLPPNTLAAVCVSSSSFNWAIKWWVSHSLILRLFALFTPHSHFTQGICTQGLIITYTLGVTDFISGSDSSTAYLISLLWCLKAISNSTCPNQTPIFPPKSDFLYVNGHYTPGNAILTQQGRRKHEESPWSFLSPHFLLI